MMVGDNDTQVSELGPSGPSCFYFLAKLFLGVISLKKKTDI